MKSDPELNEIERNGDRFRDGGLHFARPSGAVHQFVRDVEAIRDIDCPIVARHGGTKPLGQKHQVQLSTFAGGSPAGIAGAPKLV